MSERFMTEAAWTVTHIVKTGLGMALLLDLSPRSGIW